MNIRSRWCTSEVLCFVDVEMVPKFSEVGGNAGLNVAGRIITIARIATTVQSCVRMDSENEIDF